MLTYGSNVIQANATQSFWNGVFSVGNPYDGLVFNVDSTQATETFAWFGNAPMPREWVGDRQYKSVPEQTKAVANKHYENSVLVHKAVIKYDNVNAASALAGSVGVKAGALVPYLLTTLMVAGTSDSIGTAYDGQYFYDTDHVDLNGPTYTTSQSNDLTCTDGVNAVGIMGGFKAAMAAIVGFKDNEGDPWHIIDFNPANWVVMVGPARYNDLLQVLSQDQIKIGTDSYTNTAQGMFTPRVDQRITATDAMYVHYVGAPHKPFILQQSGGLELMDEKNTVTGHYAYGADRWCRAFYGEWRASCYVALS